MTSERIAFFLPSMRGGGAERSLAIVANGIAATGAQVDMVLAQAVGPYLAELSDAVTVIDLGATRVMAGLPGLVRYLRRVRPQALVSTPSHANIVAIWANWLAGKPARLVVREANAIGRGDAANAMEKRWMPLLIRGFYPWADHVVAVSLGVAGDLSSTMRVSSDTIKVIYNAVVTPDIEAKAAEPVDHPWFSSPDARVILAAGRLTPQKDFATLLRAFSRVRATVPMRLLILGEGECRGELESLVRELGLEDRVAMPGFAGNPFSYMSRANLFVLSSAWEGLPGVLLQAMACGCPVVSTDCPNGPEEILENGRWGRLVPVGDVSALASAIEQALADRQPPDVRGRAAEFGVDRAVSAYLALVGNASKKQGTGK